jgi:hypothetical protein
MLGEETRWAEASYGGVWRNQVIAYLVGGVWSEGKAPAAKQQTQKAAAYVRMATPQNSSRLAKNPSYEWFSAQSESSLDRSDLQQADGEQRPDRAGAAAYVRIASVRRDLSRLASNPRLRSGILRSGSSLGWWT